MKIGDKIEVKFAKYDPKRGRMAVIEWVPASVVFVDPDKLVVQFINGRHMTVERGRNKFRKVN